MGVEATKALRARRREAATRVERLIAHADQHSSVGSVRRARIQAAAREARRALCARESAQRALVEVETRVGSALLRICDDGLSRNEAYELLGLSRAVGRRFIELAISTRRPGTGFSTNTPRPRADDSRRDDGDQQGSRQGATPAGRNP